MRNMRGINGVIVRGYGTEMEFCERNKIFECVLSSPVPIERWVFLRFL